jgi:DNA repair exonuclease SbcCD nuclease subunit
MKVFGFGDIHFGSSRYSFVRDQEEKLCEWVLRLVKEWKCQRIVFLGDCFRERWHSGKEKDRVWMLFKEIAKEVDVVMIAGNHDYYDKACEESSLVVFRGMSGVQVVDMEVWEDRVAGKDVMYVPWKWSLGGREKLEGDVVFGHFELREAVNWEGEGQVGLDDFEGIKAVVSGHLHFRKKVGNVLYPGVPFQRNFGDGVEVGGVVVDLENMNCFWIDGYGVKFVQVDKVEDLNGLDVSKCYVRVRERGLIEKVKRLGVIGVEYIPKQVRGYDEGEKLQELEREMKIDLWQLLEEYGRKVLKVGDKESKWLKDRCKENAV